MFCKTPFWDPDVSWNTTEPDLTPCFQQTALIWTPCFYLLFLSPMRILFLQKQQGHIIPWSWKSRTKLGLAALIVILCVVEVIHSLSQHFSNVGVPVIHFLTPLLIVVTMVVYSIIVYIERTGSMRSSGFLIIFWFLMLCVCIIMTQSKIRTAIRLGEVEDLFRTVTFYLFMVLVLTILIISCFVDSTPVGAVPVEDENPCPEHHVSFLSQITFWWFSRLVVQGYKRALTTKDLWNLNSGDKCVNVTPVFNKHWQKELQKCKCVPTTPSASLEMKNMAEEPEVKFEGKKKCKKQPRLFLSMMKAFGMKMFVAAVFKFVHDSMQFIQPLILKALISYTQDKSVFEWRGYFYAVLMLLVALIQSLILHQYFHGCTIVGMRLRTAIIAAVYEKMLKLSNSARKTSTVGEIVNLMSVDAQRFMDLMTYINMVWSGPFQIIICLYLLWVTLGPSVLAGVGVMIFMVPINAFIANKTKILQVKQMRLKDKRIKMMNEILNGIKVLKLYAWEPSFENEVLTIRNKELNILKKMAYLNACTTFAWTCAPFAVSLVTFAVFVMIDPKNILDAEKAFVSLALFNLLRFPMSMVPQVVSSIVQVNVSLKRLRDFLGNDELDENSVERVSGAKHAVEVNDGDFTWDSEDAAAPTLQGINLRIPDGSLVAVVGTVGSGKSSLLQALLGEMNKVKGKVTIKGNVAYVAQQAWIQNATLQDNILFGKSADLKEYRKVIEACALQPDLEIMPAGDQTEIGEKGINLSGGQKQRVSLARAVYQDRANYLFDDPLSAVDSHVGKHIFEQVIGPDGLLKNKTRILVTHGIGFLPQVDMIVVLTNGQISEMGSYKELLSHDGAFAQFLKNYLTQELAPEELGEIIDLDEDIVSRLESVVDPEAKAAIERQVSVLSERVRTLSEASPTPPGTPSLNRHLSGSKIKLSDKEKALLEQPAAANGGVKKEEEKKLIEAESMMTGSVKMDVFLTYIRSVGIFLSCMTVLFYVLYNVASVYSNVWLSQWSDDAASANGTVDPNQRDIRLGVYGALGFLQGLFIVVACLILFIGNVFAGRKVHAKALNNVMASPMSFFDTTPVGRILNRFGKDIDVMDTVIPNNFQSWIACFLRVISVPIVVGYSTPLFIAIAIPMTLFYVVVQRFYVATSRQLKRLESVSRSPIYSHFGETVLGATTVRAYEQQERFITLSENKVDANLICHYPSIVSNRWLAIRLEFVGNCIVFFAALFAVLSRETLSPGIVGLSISYALSITQTLNWMVRMTTELETNIVAVERIKEYTETATEAAWEVAEKKPSNDWPSKGELIFKDYGTRYREGLDLVVKGISCTIKPGEKVGIVGRTGAGKSSLTLALFRIIEPAEGQIIIDDVDIGIIGLHDLRSKLTIIPQEPVLFSGTLRMNLDPFEEYSDDAVWQALEHAHLKTFVTGLASGLQFECSEGGENLSVGQRQLVCLARALLRKTKILILDEATAAVDLETDDLIQHTIRVEFKDATVLTIAHRLNTIMDYTRVMVLDAGRIKEFDAPHALLQDKNTIFYGMCSDAGLV